MICILITNIILRMAVYYKMSITISITKDYCDLIKRI